MHETVTRAIFRCHPPERGVVSAFATRRPARDVAHVRRVPGRHARTRQGWVLWHAAPELTIVRNSPAGVPPARTTSMHPPATLTRTSQGSPYRRSRPSTPVSWPGVSTARGAREAATHTPVNALRNTRSRSPVFGHVPWKTGVKGPSSVSTRPWMGGGSDPPTEAGPEDPTATGG